MTTRFIGHLLTGNHAGRPTASAVPEGTLYSCTTHSLVYQSDTSTWSTWATLGSGLADQGAFTYLDATEAAAPSTPASGKARIYAKSDGRIYSKDDAGVEYGPFDAGGGASGPLLYIDDLALHADGDDFTDDTLPGWTKVGSGTATEITTEPYDPTCLDLQFSAVSDRIYKAIGAGDWTYYLTIHGITNATPSPGTALAGMLALVATDNAGNGTGVSLYNDGQAYVWTVAGNAHAASAGISGSTGWNLVIPPTATNYPVVYRLAKVGTTITGGISWNGGASFITANRTDSTTFTRIGMTRLLSNGDTNPTLRLGRFNKA